MAKQTSAKPFNSSAEAERVANRLPELNLAAEKLASIVHGLHKRNKAGLGTEPHSVTDFINGYHRPQDIDARSSARSFDRNGQTRYLVLNREMEVPHEVMIFVDNSASMDVKAPAHLFPEQPRFSKGETAMVLAGAVAYMAVFAGEKFALMDGSMGLSGNRSAVQRMLQELQHDKIRKNLPKLPSHQGRLLKNNTEIFIFSDFLPNVQAESLEELEQEMKHELDDVRQMIKTMHRGGVKVHLIQVLDPSEVEWRYKGHVRFEDSESSFAHEIKRAEAVKDDIERIVRDHTNDLEKLVRRIPGWTFHRHVTDRDPHEALLPLYGIKPPKAPGAGPKP